MQSQHKRDKIVTTRWSEVEFKDLAERAKRAKTTPSGYLRAAALHPNECRLPPWEELRELRNEVIKLTKLIKINPLALKAAINALDRISRF